MIVCCLQCRRKYSPSWKVVVIPMYVVIVCCSSNTSMMTMFASLQTTVRYILSGRARGRKISAVDVARISWSSSSSSSSSSSVRTQSQPTSLSIMLRMVNNGRDCNSGGNNDCRNVQSKNLLSIEECLDLYNNNTNTKIKFIDATWFHKGVRNGRQEFIDGPRITDAVYWDISDISTNGELFPSDNPKKLKNVFPPEWLVGAALEKMGIIEKINDDDDNNNKKKNNNATKSTNTILVVYGRDGTLFAPRVWYTLKKYYCGGGSVKLLQGSLEEWTAQGGPVDFAPLATVNNMSMTSTNNRSNTNDVLQVKSLIDESGHRWRNKQYHHPSISWSTAKNRLVDMQFVLDFLDYKQQQQQQHQHQQKIQIKEEKEESLLSSMKEESVLLSSSFLSTSISQWPSVIIDTRGSSFTRNGHIPGSIHIPYSSLTMKDNPLKLKPKIELKQIMRAALIGGCDIDNGDDDDDDDSLLFKMLLDRSPLLTCGTGVSVCTMALVLEELGFPEPWIYDGSWNEWSQDPATPKEYWK